MHITDYEFACNFAAIELQPLIEQAEKAQAFYLDYGGEYERLSARYEILCKTLKTDSESHVFPFDQKGLDQLSAEIFPGWRNSVWRQRSESISVMR